jgi:uncharacterized protein (UPF0332 family)
MSERYGEEVQAYLQCANESIEAARHLCIAGFHDFAASRAYYAAFYAATALLLREGLEYSKHSAVISSIHQRFIKSGRLSREQGKRLNWLFELRSIGDYGGIAHVSRQQAEEAVAAATEFLQAVLELLENPAP